MLMIADLDEVNITLELFTNHYHRTVVVDGDCKEAEQLLITVSLIVFYKDSNIFV